MRAFVSTVDTPVGRNVSRVLALTVPGSRRPSGQSTGNVEDDESLDQDAPESRASEPPKVPYVVFGTLQKFLDEDGAVVTGKGVSDAGGELREEKEKKAEGEEGTSGSLEKRRKDSERKEAVDKLAILGRKPRWVEDVVQSSDREQLKEALFAADIIVYDLMTSLDEAVWACDCLSVNTEEYEDKPKTFVAISTVMAWARTKLDQDDPDAPLMEDEYRRRKPHPNFKNHVLAEKNIIKCGKKGPLRTYVIGAGLLYHAGDSIFHHFFKAAWHGEPHLTCFGDGTNILPTIHLDDLTNIVVTVADSALEPRYILAVDDSKNSLGEITKAIAESLGTAKVVNVPKEEALLQKDLSQLDHDMLLVNLRLEAGHVKELGIEWTYESGIIENLPALIHEYKNARGLTPLKIVIHGPPASGKTYFSKKLAEHYQIHLVVVEEVIKDAMARLERRASGNLLDLEEDDDVDADRELFAELTEAAKANNGRYPDENVIDFVRNKLKTMPCRNQGYILDGYPALAEEAVLLFKASGEDDDNPEEKATPLLDDVISPEFVFSLECSDEFIKERVMSLPESEVAGTRNSEEALTRRLEEFRTINTEENTVLNVFDESEIFPFAINVEGNETRGNEVLEILKKRIGKPHNYGPTSEQITIQENIAKSGRIRENQLAEEERSAREHKERLEKEQTVAIWNARMEEVRKQEQDVLEAQSVPLRNYLMRNVMPTLTAALIELCKTRPEDPIDYLAEFLFKHNPTND